MKPLLIVVMLFLVGCTPEEDVQEVREVNTYPRADRVVVTPFDYGGHEYLYVREIYFEGGGVVHSASCPAYHQSTTH